MSEDGYEKGGIDKVLHDWTPTYEIEVEWTDSVKETGLHYRAKVFQRVVTDSFKDEFSAAFDYLSGKIESKRRAAKEGSL